MTMTKADRNLKRHHHIRLDLLAIVICLTAILLAPNYRDIKEGRFYRDIMGITPFKHVNVFGTVLEPNRIIITGSMVKVRCVFNQDMGLTAYVQTENGLWHRFPVDTSVEDLRGVTGDRPPNPSAQSWGPWAIYYSGGLGHAVQWEIYAPHKDCPDEPETQTNLFAAGPWMTTKRR